MWWYMDPLYMLMMLPVFLLSLFAQIKVQTAFAKYSRMPVSSGLSGAEAARLMLEKAGLYDVAIEMTGGMLTDHYDPRTKTLRLSPQVYNARTVAAVGVACHEAGHAIQHASAYAPLMLRNAIVPMAGFGSWLAWPLIIMGIILQSMNLAILGIMLFGTIVVFQMVTLPVEFNASSRAKQQLAAMGIISSPQEARGINSVLNAAALTYVAATISALVQLLYFLLRLGLLGGGDDE